MAVREVVEICAGAGGQSLGLELGGFEHALAVELDTNAASTLTENRPWKVAVGDVADSDVWSPNDYVGIDLLAGGVPCPPFSLAGGQIGATDERDLFAWTVEQVKIIRPRALLLENVRGLSMPRFGAYRQRVQNALRELGYWSEWRLLYASNFGIAQLRPRFILVAMSYDDAQYFSWPTAIGEAGTVGSVLFDLMGEREWQGTGQWRRKADKIAPTIVGGSKKHGGADLGPTRAKRAWAALAVDGHGVADAPPSKHDVFDVGPKLTNPMVARLQGWLNHDDYAWRFVGGKTSVYRQIGNAFPPPMARQLALAIRSALDHDHLSTDLRGLDEVVHDPLYAALVGRDEFLTLDDIRLLTGSRLSSAGLRKRMDVLMLDFEVESLMTAEGLSYRLGAFRGFIGQNDHQRHSRFKEQRARIS